MITGERVSAPEGGFNPTFQRHVAAYRLCAPLLPQGRVLDLGCGTGHSFRELTPRETVGVDLEPAALEGQERETHVADMRRLPFRDALFASVLSVHSVEHVPDPDRALAEIVRVLAPGGRAVLLTPNRLTFGLPNEIIDPYHYVEYDAAQLSALCAPNFAKVEVLGLFGSARYQALVDVERAELHRLLGLDPHRLRRLLPRRARQRLYDARLRASRAVPQPGALDIGPEDFRLAPEPLTAALDLVAVCDRG
ncbi:MAG: class I SAM-dependent methyltransferase [Actinomycetota bacterium]|nr:class I SAM-dependent methyltransferase [Actinomycetota bacterium]